MIDKQKIKYNFEEFNLIVTKATDDAKRKFDNLGNKLRDYSPGSEADKNKRELLYKREALSVMPEWGIIVLGTLKSSDIPNEKKEEIEEIVIVSKNIVSFPFGLSADRIEHFKEDLQLLSDKIKKRQIKIRVRASTSRNSTNQ